MAHDARRIRPRQFAAKTGDTSAASRKHRSMPGDAGLTCDTPEDAGSTSNRRIAPKPSLQNSPEALRNRFREAGATLWYRVREDGPTLSGGIGQQPKDQPRFQRAPFY